MEVVKAVNITGLVEVVTYQAELDIWAKLQSNFTRLEYRHPVQEHLKSGLLLPSPLLGGI